MRGHRKEEKEDEGKQKKKRGREARANGKIWEKKELTEKNMEVNKEKKRVYARERGDRHDSGHGSWHYQYCTSLMQSRLPSCVST